jgi:hypothetical protein
LTAVSFFSSLRLQITIWGAGFGAPGSKPEPDPTVPAGDEHRLPD